MQKMIRTLLKDSIKIYNVSVYSTLQNHGNFSQGTLMSKALENHEKDTKIPYSLNLNNDSKSIIENIQQTYKDMDVKRTIQVMNNLRNALIKEEIFSNNDLKNTDAYLHMFQLILQKIQSLPTYDIIQILQILFFFNVPINSLLFQTSLQLIRTSLNDLSVGQIIIIYNMIRSHENVPLIKAIFIALPKVFTQQAKLELNTESNNLLQALKFSCIIRDEKTKHLILNLLFQTHQNIRVENIIGILRALCTLPKFNSVSLKLLLQIKNKIKTNCESFTFKEIALILNRISSKVENGIMEFYCDKMVDALCNSVLNRTITFQQNMIILKYLNKMRHSNTILLDHLSSKLSEDRNILKQCSLSEVDDLINSFIIADYKPPSWEIVKIILLDFVKNNDYLLFMKASTTFRLLSLGCYCPELVETVFTMYQANHLRITNTQTLVNVLKLYWCIKILYPEYTGVMLDKAALFNMSLSYKRDEEPPLLESLKETLGGVEYIKSGLKTEYGEFIEHVVVIQPNGLPMDINNCCADITFVEELDVPPGCSKILFFAFPKMAYSINKRKMLSSVLLPLKAIETMKGYYVIAIDLYLWKNLSHDKKVSYLQQAMKSKCNNVDIPCRY